MPYKKVNTDYNKSALIKTEESQPSLSDEMRDELMHYGVRSRDRRETRADGTEEIR